MSHTAKLAPALAALALTAAALASCSATAPAAADPSPTRASSHAPESSATPASVETDPDACAYFARVHMGTMRANLSGKPVDRGTRDFAAGTVGLNDEGKIVTYTVAPGDALYAIGERLCIENAWDLAPLNHTQTIQPGQVLLISPDPDVPWVPYLSPIEASAGFQQIPYQHAIWAMGAAADAGDVDTMRTIWADGLSAMFSNPEYIGIIQQALDSGDLTVLSQMFS